MKKTYYLFIIFCLIKSNNILAQNDCVDAIFICGDTNLTGLTTEGFGVQEINFSNACSSFENNSLWLKVKIKNGGTFGFTITPENTNLVVDFDFWIYGPNATCSNLGNAIRCSTTNPLQAALTYNTTGLNNIENDQSEGPGLDGNSFVQFLNVVDNEEYFIAIDRPVGDSNFSINWNGTATFFDQPIIENLNTLNSCGKLNSLEIVSFNLTQNQLLAIGSQENVIATFYNTLNNAITNTNVILNPTNYESSGFPETVYIRVTNTITNCFEISSFDLVLIEPVDPILNFNYTTPICSEGFNVLPNLQGNFTAGGNFTATPNGLSINPETGEIDIKNSSIGTYEINYTITDNNQNCYSFYKSDTILTINFCKIPKGVSPNNDTKNDTFNLENFDIEKVTIYNRYGVEVYSKINYKNEWKGQSNNSKKLPDGTYYYLINLKNGLQRTGWVYLINEN